MERKLAAILAADLTGCGRMMERDEEEILDAHRSHREVVEGLTAAHRKHAFNSAGGTINRVLPVLPRISGHDESASACGPNTATASASPDFAGK